MQIDGSCDRQMLDHKFVSGRMANSDGSVTSVFVVMHSPEKNGASGLLEAVNKALDLTEGKDTKLVGVTITANRQTLADKVEYDVCLMTKCTEVWQLSGVLLTGRT